MKCLAAFLEIHIRRRPDKRLITRSESTSFAISGGPIIEERLVDLSWGFLAKSRAILGLFIPELNAIARVA